MRVGSVLVAVAATLVGIGAVLATFVGMLATLWGECLGGSCPSDLRRITVSLVFLGTLVIVGTGLGLSGYRRSFRPALLADAVVLLALAVTFDPGRLESAGLFLLAVGAVVLAVRRAD
jgi:hypothetical protein